MQVFGFTCQVRSVPLCTSFPCSALTLLVRWQERYLACKMLDVGLLVVTIWLKLCMSYRSSCHHSPPPSSLAPVKSRMETFWYRLTEVHLENGCWIGKRLCLRYTYKLISIRRVHRGQLAPVHQNFWFTVFVLLLLVWLTSFSEQITDVDDDDDDENNDDDQWRRPVVKYGGQGQSDYTQWLHSMISKHSTIQVPDSL